LIAEIDTKLTIQAALEIDCREGERLLPGIDTVWRRKAKLVNA